MLSRDEKTLYVNNSNGEYLLAFDVKPDGTLANRRNFAKYQGGDEEPGRRVLSGAEGWRSTTTVASTRRRQRAWRCSTRRASIWARFRFARAAEHRVCRAGQEDAVHRRPRLGVQGRSVDGRDSRAGPSNAASSESPSDRSRCTVCHDPARFTLRRPSSRPASAAAGSAASSRRPSGSIGLGAVLCFHFPELLTTPEARALYPLPYVRALLHLVLVAAFVLGAISLTLRQQQGAWHGRRRGGAGRGGSGRVAGRGRRELAQGPFLGLDWLLVNLLLYSLIFIPIERLFARLPEQGIFRRGWRTDLTYFFVSALLVQVTRFSRSGRR